MRTTGTCSCLEYSPCTQMVLCNLSLCYHHLSHNVGVLTTFPCRKIKLRFIDFRSLQCLNRLSHLLDLSVSYHIFLWLSTTFFWIELERYLKLFREVQALFDLLNISYHIIFYSSTLSCDFYKLFVVRRVSSI